MSKGYMKGNNKATGTRRAVPGGRLRPALNKGVLRSTGPVPGLDSGGRVWLRRRWQSEERLSGSACEQLDRTAQTSAE